MVKQIAIYKSLHKSFGKSVYQKNMITNVIQQVILGMKNTLIANVVQQVIIDIQNNTNNLLLYNRQQNKYHLFPLITIDLDRLKFYES